MSTSPRVDSANRDGYGATPMHGGAPSPSSSPHAANPHAAGGAHIRATDVTKTFLHGGRELHVLRGLNFTLNSGEMVAIVGASGAGKSTLLQIVGTLDNATSGRIEFDGVEVTALSPRKLSDFRNQNIGFIFQFHHLLPEFDALENVMMPGLIARQNQRDCRVRAEELLVRVGLRDCLHHRPGELSGGEQQRVALARALFLRPRLLLGDEPTGNLDTRTGRAVHELLFELNRELGTTILLVTHNDELSAQTTRRLRMVDGAIVEET